MATVKLSKRSIDALSVDRGDRVFWDSELPGFGVRVHATGRKVFVAQARVPGGLPKRAVIGRCVDMTAGEARKKAAEVVDRIRRGEDPAPLAPKEPTVADLAARYMDAHVTLNCRPGTVEVVGRLLDRHILPELGGLKHLLRNAAERTTEATWRRIGALLDRFSPSECANYFRNAGYASEMSHRALGDKELKVAQVCAAAIEPPNRYARRRLLPPLTA